MEGNDKFVNYGGDGDALLFAHANAYTPLCYRKFLLPFQENFNVIAPMNRPLWGDQNALQLKSWNLFRDDLIRFMDSQEMKGVVGVGHSLGGIACWMAAIKRPDLFSRLVLIDPVLIASFFSYLTNIFPFWFKKKYLPIVAIASKRRYLWKNRDEVRDHLGQKKIFQRFDPEVFKDFLKYGIVDEGTRVTLAFTRDWEARIYATPPNMWSIISKTPCPVHIIKAQFSDVISAKDWDKLKSKTSAASFFEMPAVGHLLPFEKPNELSAYILDRVLNVK